MIQSPSKYLPRAFLRTLIKNNCISACGVEYSEPEVRELLTEKDSRLAIRDYDRELKKRNAWSFDLNSVVTFQDSLIPGILRGLEKTCQPKTQCEKSNDSIIFSLHEIARLPDDGSSTEISIGGETGVSRPVSPLNGGKKMKFPGKQLTEIEAMDELRLGDEFLSELIKSCERTLSETGKSGSSKKRTGKTAS